MSLHIATPCHEDWNGMTPDGPGRHCASCDKTVIDLTALPPSASQRELAAIAARTAAGEKLCVRGHAGRDGRLRATRARRRLLTNGMAAMIAVAMSGALGGCGDQTLMGSPVPTPQPVQSAPATTGEVSAAASAMGGVAEAPQVEPGPEPAMMGDVCAPVRAPAPEPLMGKVAASPASR